MVLTVHHLRVSQSERIPWLLEELGVPYELVLYKRNTSDRLAPPELKNLPGNTIGTAPVFTDSEAGVTLAESGAIMQYILAKYGKGKLVPDPSDSKAFANYLNWFNRTNASCLPAVATNMYLMMAGVADENPVRQRVSKRWQTLLEALNDHLSQNKWLAGDEFTAADIMAHFGFAGGRYFFHYSLAPYPHIMRWTGDCAARPKFKDSFAKADPDLKFPLGAEPPTTRPWEQQ